MQNILIVCADKELRKDVSKVLAKQLNCLYVDVDEVLDYELLNCQDTTIIEAGKVLEQLEQKAINRALEFKNCIVTISRNLFVSNNNFKLISNFKKFYISLSKAQFATRIKHDQHRIEQELLMYNKINTLINNNCDKEIVKEIKSVEDITSEIIQHLKQ